MNPPQLRLPSPAVIRKASQVSPGRVCRCSFYSKTLKNNKKNILHCFVSPLASSRKTNEKAKRFATVFRLFDANQARQQRACNRHRSEQQQYRRRHCCQERNQRQCSRMRCELEAPAARLQCACSGPVHASRESLCPRSQHWPGSMGRPHLGQVTCSPAAMRFHHWARSRWCALP